jgi:hypothetical protein
MTRRITLKHTLVAALAASALAASPAGAKPTDRVDRFDSPTSSLAGTTTPKQDLRGEYARDAARAAEQSGLQVPPVEPKADAPFQVGQPTWPVDPAPAAKPVSAVKSAPALKTDGDNDVWLVLGIGLAATGIVAGSAAGIARRTRRVPA